MNTKKTGAVALSAVALIVAISGCAGVRAQVDAGAGQSSLQNQADTQRQEMADVRARQHAVPLDAGKLAANEAVRADKQVSTQQKAAAHIGGSVGSVQELVRADKQASANSGLSAADAQGARLTKQAEAYRAQTEEDALQRVADEERRAQHPEQW